MNRQLKQTTRPRCSVLILFLVKNPGPLVLQRIYWTRTAVEGWFCSRPQDEGNAPYFPRRPGPASIDVTRSLWRVKSSTVLGGKVRTLCLPLLSAPWNVRPQSPKMTRLHLFPSIGVGVGVGVGAHSWNHIYLAGLAKANAKARRLKTRKHSELHQLSISPEG